MPAPEAVIDLVRAGFGICLFGRWAIGTELASGTLVKKPPDPDRMSLNRWTVARADEKGNTPASRLVQVVMDRGGGHGTGLDILAFQEAPGFS